MRPVITNILFVFTLLASSHSVLGQYVMADSLFSLRAVSNIKKIHSLKFQSQQHLYNGKAYKELLLNPEHDIGHPFFGENEITLSALEYRGIFYDSVPLAYDLVQDQLVTTLPGTGLKIVLISAHIGTSLVSGHRFNYLSGDSLSKKHFNPGIHEVLFDGTVKVYAKRRKVIAETDQGAVIRKKFLKRDKFLLFKDTNYFAIHNKQSLLHAFIDQQKALENFLRQSGLKFRRHPERTIVAAAEFYEKTLMR